MTYSHHTMGSLVAQVLTLNTVLANVVSVLTSDQRAKVLTGLTFDAQQIELVDDFEPDYSGLRAEALAHWIEALARQGADERR